MAALVEGHQYGLSAQDKINTNKSIIFVKLTDSALRSIEEYVKNKGITHSKPTIQFQNSSGVINLPQNGSSHSFRFALSNVEADGPQGSFECLRQSKHKLLESLGTMHMKMHIHATEDSYENTRVKMAAVEKEQKKSFTKVIKPSGSHLGRKVKVKRPALVVSPIKSSPPAPHLRKEPPKILSPSLPTNKIPAPKPQFPQPPQGTKSKNKFANSPELLRQPIRDRIIHILALRPYKKPELLVRLMNEGIREKDRNGITAILSQVGALKGNVYQLANYCWIEVQESWKFCTQSELEIIRKRKQQYINSSESENCLSNIQPNISPPQVNSLKKRLAIDTVSSIQEPSSKKQRISHYSRPDPGTSSVKVEDNSHRNSLSIPDVRKGAHSPRTLPHPLLGTEDEPNHKSNDILPVSRNSSDSSSQRNSANSSSKSSFDVHSYRNGDSSSKNFNGQKSGSSPIPRTTEIRPTHKVDEQPKNGVVYSDNGRPSQKQTLLSHPPICDPKVQVSPDSNSQFQKVRKDHCSNGTTNGYTNGHTSYVNRTKVTSTTNGSCSNSPHSSSDSRDSMDCNGIEFQVPPLSESESPDHEYEKYTNGNGDYDSCQDYEKEYIAITSSEQRGKYKTSFNTQYEEYLHLHSKIKLISKKFASLERRLHTYPEDSEDFKNIKSQIYKEYRAYQRDPNYIEALKKFNYLHGKLSHIKRLVMEYDNVRFGKS